MACAFRQEVEMMPQVLQDLRLVVGQMVVPDDHLDRLEVLVCLLQA